MTEPISILLVEDDRHIALALQIRLRAAGYDVILANSVSDALLSVGKRLPDIALLDINLPDGDGIQLMRSFGALDDHKEITFIIMTASRKPGLKEHALAHGAHAFLEKPFASALLLEAVVGRHRPSQAC